MKHPIRRAICLHEAGHCIAACALGANVTSVTVEPSLLMRGGACVDTSHLSDDEQDVVNAGGDAGLMLVDFNLWQMLERDLEQQSNRNAARVRDTFNAIEPGLGDRPIDFPGDVEMIERHATKAGTDPAARVFRSVHRAADIIEAHRLALEILADELDLFGTVEGARVHQIFDGAWRRQPTSKGQAV